MTVARSLALAIFLMTYLGLALGRVPGLRIDRTGIAIVGAAAAVVTGAIPWDRAVSTLDEPLRAWLLVAMASTLAGNLTLIGSVANLIVVEAARGARIEIGVVEYARLGVPITVITLLVGWALVR